MFLTRNFSTSGHAHFQRKGPEASQSRSHAFSICSVAISEPCMKFCWGWATEQLISKSGAWQNAGQRNTSMERAQCTQQCTAVQLRFNAGAAQRLTPNTCIIWDTGDGRFLLTYCGSPSFWEHLVHVDLLNWPVEKAEGTAFIIFRSGTQLENSQSYR